LIGCITNGKKEFSNYKMEYDFRKIEKEWQKKWKESGAYKVENPIPEQVTKPKCYVLDMFPYPSGAGLHVGHPLGYIASDIYARFKRLKGYNVLHPMGYDAFGLPAEQYAIDHGIHPAISTENNINTFRRQLDNIGISFDWSRELRTSDPKYYKWTQWIFLRLFKSFFNRKAKKAESIDVLIAAFEKEGNLNHPIPNTSYQLPVTSNREPENRNFFTAEEWKSFDEFAKQGILMEYRLAYCGYGEVNWCEALGTVLANDEVINGVSERGGYPVVKKKLRQWYLRITEYADRLLEGLERVDFSEAMKEMQTNWIGKSSGAEVEFRVGSRESGVSLRIYTTRPDTIFGVDFMVIAPEHELVEKITTQEQKKDVDEYISYVKSRSERERQAEKKITGAFTGAYALNPFNGREIPIWISEYVLIGYGTGAIMAVPCGDERDHKFAKHFGIPITNIIGKHYNGEEANPTKDAILENSDFINGMVMKDAIEVVIKKIEELGIGEKKVNYKMRDAAFSRQRYWGEPFPIVWKNGIAYPLDESELPLELPHVESYKPGPEGEGPLANISEWYLIPNPSPQAEKGAVGAANVPKYAVHTPTQYELARRMRKEHTEAEKKLWDVLRVNKSGIKFRRQHPIGAYIVDFVSLQDKLIVEVDGGYHETEEQKKYDEERTRVLKEIGFDVIRFSNEEVLKNPYTIKKRIKETIAESSNNSPLRPRSGVGGEVQALRETNTMPGYAGSSWYFLRYMDPYNDKEFCDRKVSDYWNQVDLYIGGTEHAVGHLLYSRMWTKALCDLGCIGHDEPYKKLVNQGMIGAYIKSVYRLSCSYKLGPGLSGMVNVNKFIKEHGVHPNEYKPKIPQVFVSSDIAEKIKSNTLSEPEKNTLAASIQSAKTNAKDIIGILNYENEVIEIPVESFLVDRDILDVDLFQQKSRLADSKNVFVFSGSFYCKNELGKMSKRYYNTENPDDIVTKYGADTFRMYEMFLGPVEQSKPWDTKGIEGVHRFLKKLWRLFYDEVKGPIWTTVIPSPSLRAERSKERAGGEATEAELKVLHRAIKKIEDDTERFSFNTGVSAFMIAVNELTDLKCHKKEILEPLLILLAPYAPHIAEELYNQLNSSEVSPGGGDLEGAVSILNATYPKFEEKYLIETTKEYPISVNGRLRTTMNISLDAEQHEVEKMVLENDVVKKWLEGKQPKRIIYVKNKMINVVI
jgi:leucyl-tRNA synthetase